jgi:hypothetical protein
MARRTIRVAGIIPSAFLGAIASCAVLAPCFGLASPRAGHASTTAKRMSAGGVLIPSSPREVLPFSGGTVHSSNWSGYAVRSKRHQITGASGTFMVPRATGSGTQAAATWAGIGGFKTQDLIQAGTAEDALPTLIFGKQYFAWYELLPNPEVRLHGCKGDSTCKVKPGNHMSVKITSVGTNRWRIAVRNAGHWSWSKTVSYHSSRSSAEWILESPMCGACLTLADVGTVHFGPTSKYNSGGAAHTISQGNPVKIILTGQAKPSPLAPNGQSFNDCSYRSGSCPRP